MCKGGSLYPGCLFMEAIPKATQDSESMFPKSRMLFLVLKQISFLINLHISACLSYRLAATLLIHYHPILYLSSHPVVLDLSLEDLCILIPKTSRLQIVCTTITSSLLTNMSQVSKKWLPFFCFLS